MLTINKSGFKIIFISDKYSELNSILRELHLVNNIGSPYPQVFIEKNYNFYDIDSIKILYGSNIYYILDSDINFKYSSPSELVDKMNVIFSDYLVFIDNIRFDGVFELIGSQLLRSKSGDYLAVGNFHVNQSGKLDNFIHLMKRDNGHIINPLTKKFLRAILHMKNHKHAILGYAHLPTYLKIIKMEQINGDSNTHHPDNRAQYILNTNGNISTVSINILDISDNKANLKLSISGSELIKNNLDKLNSPYVLMAAKPIKIDNKRIPFFTVMLGKIPIFVSVLLFNDDTHLRTVPGNIDLLEN